ncbi:glycosyltransferase family 4 protein [Crenothrix polyspora]|uniref:Glycosyl transferase, group 1 n=1 Tax=Crenothrix polyspora TaxID=360316 RepID=A0A1R4HEV8_9GAMM|nr:glycosyltransferase family 4 protein [Crenothrix polyspora]SJM94571.1 Glycosyl transferase, group 1 [Crenothrix polyspora]
MLTTPRVALVSLHFAEYSINLAVALSKKTQVMLILYQDNADNELGADWLQKIPTHSLNIVVLSRPKTAWHVIKNSQQFIKTIRQFSPDIIHYQEDPRDELMLSLAFLAKIPSVLTIHDPKRHSGLDAVISRFTFYRMIVRRSADSVITHGDIMATELMAMYPRLKNKLWSIAHGPLGVGFNGTVAAHPNNCRLLFFGRINAYKGLSFFVEAIIALRAKGHPVIGVIAGRGADLEPNRQRMLDAGGFEIIDKYIAAEDIPDLFLGSLITVLPYTDGTQSGVAAMALGFGRPVVASAVGSIPELVREGINGLLVPACDTEKLTQALESIISNASLWNTLANGALHLKYGELSWETIADKTLLAYTATIQAKAAL